MELWVRDLSLDSPPVGYYSPAPGGLPVQGSSACVVHRHPSAGSLSGNSCVSYGCRRLCFVSVCVYALMSGDTPQENIHNNPLCPSTFTRPILL